MCGGVGGMWGCMWGCGGVCMFMLSNEDTYMNFNLNTVDVPSNEDGPRSSDVGVWGTCHIRVCVWLAGESQTCVSSVG